MSLATQEGGIEKIPDCSDTVFTMAELKNFGFKTFIGMTVLFWTVAPLAQAIGDGSPAKRPVTEAPELRDSVTKTASEKSFAEQRALKGVTSASSIRSAKRNRAPASAPVQLQPNTGPDAGTAATSPEKAAHRTTN